MENLLNDPYQNQKEEVPYDVVDLPSEGKLYPNGLSSIKLEFVTADDENILTSPELLKSGDMINKLLTKKVKGLTEAGIDITDLLSGDRNAITIALRINAYGEIYKKKMTTPMGRTEIFNIDLTRLESKPLLVNPDEDGLFSYTLLRSKKVVKFKLLTAKDEDYIRTKALATKNKDGINPFLTTRLETIIKDFDGETDPIFIAKAVKNMLAIDSMGLRQYIDGIEPGVDMNYEFQASDGETFTQQIIIDFDFFYPNLSL